MFARVLALLPLVAFVVADTTVVNQCNTGPIQCCNSVQEIDQCMPFLESNNLVSAAIAAGAAVGLTCSDITVIGVSSSCQASQQAVCCTNNNFNGVASLGCTPVNVQA